MTPQTAAEIWARASQEEIGLVVTFATSNDVENVKGLLYSVRKELANPELEKLSICRPGDAPNEIIIIRRTVSLDDASSK